MYQGSSTSNPPDSVQSVTFSANASHGSRVLLNGWPLAPVGKREKAKWITVRRD
jgi:hypothetical protein